MLHITSVLHTVAKVTQMQIYDPKSIVTIVVTYLSPFNSLSQETDNIFSFTFGGFEAFGPIYQISLRPSQHVNIKISFNE